MNDWKKLAINSWLNKRGKYLSTLSLINSMSKKNANELRNHLVKEELRQGVLDRVVKLTEYEAYPYVISVEYGLLLYIDRNVEFPIHWSEVISFCRQRFKEIGKL